MKSFYEELVDYQNKELSFINTLFDFCKYLMDLGNMIDEDGNEIPSLAPSYYFDEITYEISGHDPDYLLLRTVGFDPEDSIFDEVIEFEVPIHMVDLYIDGEYEELAVIWKDECKREQEKEFKSYLDELEFKASCIGYKLIPKE